MLKIFSFTLTVLAFIFLVSLVTGYLIGEEYRGEETLSVNYSPSEVWEVITNLEKIPAGRADVDSVEIIVKYLNLYIWQENSNKGKYRIYKHIKKEENKYMLIEMTESSYDVTGTWEFFLDEKDKKTTITIKEESKNTSIVKRGFRFYFGRNKETLDWLKLIRVRLYNNLLEKP